MHIHEVKAAIEAIAPAGTQAEWDNSGVQLCYGPVDIKKLLVAMEINDHVISEALETGANMIVTHHPLIFNPIRSIHACHPEGRRLVELIKNNISVYSCHTPFDKAEGGTNDYILKALGCENIRAAGEGEESFLKLGELPEPKTLDDVCAALNAFLENPGGIQISGKPSVKIRRIAICTGAGGEFYESALQNGADLFITGEMKHHEAAAAAASGLCLAVAGHYGTEWLFARNMAAQLRERLGGKIEIIESSSRQNPYDAVL